jgi:cytoskeleton protein RodZ
MASPGSVLQQEREKQGRTIEEIARELCIAPSYLHAIETDNHDKLPGAFFYRSFVRQYSAVLGLDPRALPTDLQAVTVVPPTEVNDASPIRVPDAIVQQTNRADLSSRNWTVPVAALLLALALGGGFYAWWQQPRTAEVPPVAVVPTPVPAPIAPALVEPAPVAPPVDLTALETQTPPVAEQVAEPAPPVAVGPELNLVASQDTWISISSNGKRIFEGILKASESKTLPDLEAARLTVGNAAGISVRWKGQDVGTIGKSGQRRVVVLSPDGVRITAPTPVAPPPTPSPSETL